MAKAQSIKEPVMELSAPRRIWRWFRSMRTALVLVLILAVGSIIGTLIPQENLDPSAVAMFKQQNAGLSNLFNALSFFNVYYSWWFILNVAMLFVSLIACLIPRTNNFIKKYTKPSVNPVTDVFVKNLKTRTGFAISLSSDKVLDKCKEALRARRFTIREIPGKTDQFYAEKGRFGGFGSLLFHYMFLLLLIGVVFGKTTGFEGSANIIEGESFVENRFNFSQFAPGPLFKSTDHTNFKLALDDFEVTYNPDGQAKDFISRVRLYDDNGKLVEKTDVKVNKKLVYKGVKMYQSSYGWAPHVAIYKDGKKIYDQASVFYSSQGPSVAQSQLSPDSGLSLDAFFVPDLQIDQKGQFSPGTPSLKNPALYIVAKGTDDNGQQKTLFDSQNDGIINLKGKKKIGDGYEIEFSQLKEYTGLQIIKDDGVPIVYASFIFAILGLYITFYISHRKVWALVRKDEKGKNQLLMGGITEKNQGAFEAEFQNIAEDVKSRLKKGAAK